MTAFARINDHSLTSVTVYVPSVGPWWADVEFEGGPDVSGRVSLWIGGLELVGTIDPSHDGVTGVLRKSRIVAGAGGWGMLLAAKAYHNDAGIRARTIAEDAAREAGETLGDFTPAQERVGIDYVRQAGPASRVIEDVIGGVPWWVDYDGRTNVGAREEVEASGYEVLEFDPADRIAVLGADEIDEIRVGRTIVGDQIDGEQMVRELEIQVKEGGLRLKAWTGGTEDSRSRLVDAMRSIVTRSTDRKLFGLWKYRVVQMSGDRVELQAVRRRPGLPDLLPISAMPGVAGAHADLAPGAEVLVQFVEGDRTQPIVTHFAGKDGVGWTPVSVILSASSTLRLGSESAADGVSLSSRCNALWDAFTGTPPVANDGGAAIQAAVNTVWTTTLGENVGSGKVLAE